MSDATRDGGGSARGDDPLQTARDLQGALEGMTAQLAAVKATVRRGKLVAAALALSLALDVTLTVIVSITAVQLLDVQLATCQAGNQTRANEVRLWNHLAAASTPPPGETPQQAAKAKQEVAGLLAYIRATFAPRDCASLYHIRP